MKDRFTHFVRFFMHTLSEAVWKIHRIENLSMLDLYINECSKKPFFFKKKKKALLNFLDTGTHLVYSLSIFHSQMYGMYVSTVIHVQYSQSIKVRQLCSGNRTKHMICLFIPKSWALRGMYIKNNSITVNITNGLNRRKIVQIHITSSVNCV